ncbi:IS1 transposase [Holospora elegans E1]|uniref:IS1 transposase n=1 Tax=Holospora elegans E1 TaxID=1427503 RepID=A0A023DX36_9PROT|nr:IS1 family transposase [Holospora elegans]GAJ45802.1 IS1 transposase [Holospora elegans E1]
MRQNRVIPRRKGIVKEVDEFWHYLKKEARNFGFLKLKVCDRAGKRLIDWEFGDHYSQTFKRLFERLKKWKILFYCKDHWAGFNKIIPIPHPFQGKDKTFSIEQNNAPHLY